MDALGHTTTYTYDNWGRVTVVTAPDGTRTSTSYDPNGNVLSVTDADGHTGTSIYDADNRLIQTTNGRGDVVRYAYDGTNGYGTRDVNGQTQFGLLSSKTDGNGHTTYYTYTARNEPYQSFYPDGSSEGFAYDANGNPIVRARLDGSLIHYAYDADNRLTDVTYPHMPAVHYDYDRDGRQTHMHDSIGDTYWYFDDGLHLTHLSSNRGNVYYGYDADGRRTSMGGYGLNPSAPNTPYTYGLDAGGRLISLQNPFGETTSYQYDAADRLTQKTLANGTHISYDYDSLNRTIGLHYISTGGSYSHHYTYEPNGSLSSRSEDDGGTNSFGHDGVGQLTSETRTGPVPFTEAYTYDHNSNRLTMTQNGALVQSFAYDSRDRITGGINESDSVDVNGDLRSCTLNGQTSTLTYDDEDRLTRVSFPGGRTDTFTYNGLGQRITKSDPTGSYWYMNDGAGSDAPVLTDAYTTFTPGVSEYNSLGSRFYLPDKQGNSRGLLDKNQYATDGYNWDAWGNSVSRLGTNPTALAWGEGSGYQNDNNGLKMLGSRYYDSRTGRFISRDSVQSGNNWYAYCNNDPSDGTDPTGNTPIFTPGMYQTVGEQFDAVLNSFDLYDSGDTENVMTHGPTSSGAAVGSSSFDLYLGGDYSQTYDDGIVTYGVEGSISLGTDAYSLSFNIVDGRYSYLGPLSWIWRWLECISLWGRWNWYPGRL